MDRARIVTVVRGVAWYLAAALAVAVVLLPLAVERAVERVSVEERIGTIPVEVSLARNGRSTLATGLLGDVYYQATGPFGLGVEARVLGPPEAGGTLASYADPRFIRANLAFVHDPEAVTRAYGREFRDQIVGQALRWAVVGGLLGAGFLLAVVVALRRSRSRRSSRLTGGRRVALLAVAFLGSFAVATGAAYAALGRWSDATRIEAAYPLPRFPKISFGSPQTRELARQVQPFIEKNTERIRERQRHYTDAAEASFSASLQEHLADVTPREGEVLVVAEADPQGGYVGTDVRTALFERLTDALGEDAIAMRTISGDITSNGTVAEGDFVAGEAAVGGDVPTVAVAGDHDSEATVGQMRDEGMTVPDLETVDVGGLHVAGANDVENKALFGALVSNESGLTEHELGARLGEEVSADEARIVLLHQPAAAEGYLGVTIDDLREQAGGSRTTPYDDGIPDLPPGTVSIGHLHDLEGPWLVWNTSDPDDVTWTVVDQLGTSGGMEERPTFNRFSTPISPPLKQLSFRFQLFDTGTGLQTGYATVTCSVEGRCDISPRVDLGLPVTDPRVSGE